jgi:hypothetical protein
MQIFNLMYMGNFFYFNDCFYIFRVLLVNLTVLVTEILLKLTGKI